VSTEAQPVRAVADGSAGGKIILLGEHAVVYGAPAVAAGIDLGARARATRLGSNEPSVLSLGGRSHTPTDGDDVARAFAALLSARAAPPVSVEAESDLPAGGGLGSSAALGVAIGRALEALCAPDVDPDHVLVRARAWEEVFHGTPSGIDTAAALHGGCFRFSRVHGVRPIAVGRDLCLCVGWSGAGSSTRAMVEGVARLNERKPDVVSSSMRAITSLVDNAALAIQAGDVESLGRLMNYNQMILAGLMLSTDSIEQLCALARSAGALGAKLTGAGGGGSVIALVRERQLDVAAADPAGDATAVLAAWKSAGFAGFTACVRASDAAVPEEAR
jgi:mevalonate kinase